MVRLDGAGRDRTGPDILGRAGTDRARLDRTGLSDNRLDSLSDNRLDKN